MAKIQRNPAQRRSEIRKLLLARGALSVDELCALVSASPATIRRDLDHLQQATGIERTHGGAAMQTLRPAEQKELVRLLGRIVAGRAER